MEPLLGSLRHVVCGEIAAESTPDVKEKLYSDLGTERFTSYMPHGYFHSHDHKTLSPGHWEQQLFATNSAPSYLRRFYPHQPQASYTNRQRHIHPMQSSQSVRMIQGTSTATLNLSWSPRDPSLLALPRHSRLGLKTPSSPSASSCSHSILSGGQSMYRTGDPTAHASFAHLTIRAGNGNDVPARVHGEPVAIQ